MTLGNYNTVALALNTPTQLLPPVPGHCFYTITNGTGNLFVSGSGSVGANAASCKYPASAQITIPVTMKGVWVSADAAGPINVIVIPRG